MYAVSLHIDYISMLAPHAQQTPLATSEYAAINKQGRYGTYVFAQLKREIQQFKPAKETTLIQGDGGKISRTQQRRSSL